MTVRQQRKMTDNIHFSDTDRRLIVQIRINIIAAKITTSKKFDAPLIPRYKGTYVFGYEIIWSTIRKTIRKTRL